MAASSSGKLVGIDLGTTFCAIATLDDRGQAVTLPNIEGEMLTPSAVLIEDGGAVVGQAGVDDLVLEARARWTAHPATLPPPLGQAQRRVTRSPACSGTPPWAATSRSTVARRSPDGWRALAMLHQVSPGRTT